VLPLDVRDLTRAADQIVIGDVIDVQSNWNAAHDLIESRVVVRVDDYLLGGGSGTVTLTIPGGTVDRLSLHVSVLPELQIGDHVLLFLDQEASRLVGAYQGAYLTDGTSVVRMGAGCRRTVPQTQRPLSAMLEDIQAALGPQVRLPGIKPYEGTFSMAIAAATSDFCGYDWTWLPDPISVTYYINANASVGCAGPAETQIAEIQKGMDAWNNAGACFGFRYGGQLSCSLDFDEKNCIYFSRTPPYPEWVIAANYHWILDETMMVESDIVFNAWNFTWSHSDTTCCDMDIWNIATHELGHTLCLLDQYDDSQSSRTMYGYADYCDVFARTLHVDDIAAMRAIYGGCGEAGACCDGQSCTQTILADCAHQWFADTDCTFFRCPEAGCDVEGFESGDFTAFPWVLSGDADWHIDTSSRASGAYSARAGDLTHRQQSSLEVAMPCVTGDVSFQRRVSSESNFDLLKFYIDGVFKGSWSGSADWNLASFPVPAGTHTFKWTYAKDESISSGQDTAWIDDIAFPITCGSDCCPQFVFSYPLCTDFEPGLGSWVDDTDDDIDWQRAIGATPTPGTGPSAAHGGRIYAYTEATNTHDKIARLDLCADLASTQRPELVFWYHMYGAQMGTLSVGVRDENCIDWTLVWSESGNQGNEWREARVDLSPFRGRRITISFAGRTGPGDTSDMAIDDVCVRDAPPCPTGTITFIEPPDGAVDARQPHPGDDPGMRQGFHEFLIQGPVGADNLRCWSPCESLTEGYSNAINGVTNHGNGQFTLSLVRPISAGAVTTLTYTDDAGNKQTGSFSLHPGNVNGDSYAAPDDILNIIDCLNGFGLDTNCPWGMYSADVDRSDLVTPADVLMVIDLLNGAGTNDPWANTPRPTCGRCCP